MKFCVIKYGMAVDLDRCTGCYSCQVGCLKENSLTAHTEGIQLFTQETGTFPYLKRIFIPRICSSCERPECIRVCTQDALTMTDEGIVRHDPEKCIGCNLCVSACPTGSIRTGNGGEKLNKCDWCHERLLEGKKPVCVENCMGKAMYFGALNDKNSELSKILIENKDNLYVRREAASSLPKVFYIQRGGNSFDVLKNADLSEYDLFDSHTEAAFGLENNKNEYINSVDMMCPAECSIKLLVKDGKALKICGNPRSLNNHGSLCSKGAAALEFVYSADRIRTPLIRDGERGSGKWKEISWDLAVKKIAASLTDIKKRYGAEAVVLDCGDLTDHEPYMILFHAFGTPNTYTHSAICDTNRRWGPKNFMDDERPLPDIQRPLLIRDKEGGLRLRHRHDIKLLINVGANPLVATRFSYMSRGIPEAKITNDMYYIVIDPNFTNSAAKADLWLSVIPGTDAELLACMLYYIIVNDDPDNSDRAYIDHDFLGKYTEDWERFREDFLVQSRLTDESNGKKYFSSGWGEHKTGISAAEIERLSHLMGITKPAAIEIGMHGAAHHTDGDITSVLATVLCAVTGNIDVPGGLVFAGTVKPKLDFPSAKLGNDSVISRVVGGELRSGRISELHKDIYGDYPDAWKGALSITPYHIKNGAEIKRGPFKGLTYPIKAFINRTGNPVYTGGNTGEWISAFTAEDKLDLIVHIDTHLNETGKYADIILPECSFLEKMGLSDQYTINPEISLRDRVIKPMYASETPFGIMKKLAKALAEAGDREIDPKYFGRFTSEEVLLDEELKICPSMLNIGSPLPYPQYPEGARIEGTPDDPNVYLNDKLIHKGKTVTVRWLRENGGIAAWPVGYYRYRRGDDGSISKCYPGTVSGRFSFGFGYGKSSNKAFVWKENNNCFRADTRKKYPFFLITGRTHQTGTMTQYCRTLSGLETDTDRILTKDGTPGTGYTVPVLLMNTYDGKRHGISSGNIITLESPDKKTVCGKAFLSESIRKGVIKTSFGQGGRTASSEQYVKMAKSTVNVNELYDPSKVNKTTGMPAFGDIVVRIIKKEEDKENGI